MYLHTRYFFFDFSLDTVATLRRAATGGLFRKSYIVDDVYMHNTTGGEDTLLLLLLLIAQRKRFIEYRIKSRVVWPT